MNSRKVIDLNQIMGELNIYVLKRVKDRTVADDIVQDVLVKFHTRMGQLKNSEKLMAWVYQIARNTIIDHFRKKRTIDPALMDWESATNSLNDCVAHCLQKLTQTLPQKYREAFQLSEIESISQRELAQRLGISYSGAKSRVQRARHLLRRKIEELLIIKTDTFGNVITCEDRKPCCCDRTQDHSFLC